MTRIGMVPPPFERSQIRLSTLVGKSDAQGNTCSFDPWPLAGLGKKLSKHTRKKWKQLNEEMSAADKSWTGSIVRRPLQQFLAASRCLGLKSAIEKGDGGAVLEAVAQCAAHGLVMPAWLALEYVERYQRVVTGQCREWSSHLAFGPALSKGQNIAGLRARTRDAPWAYDVAVNLLSENPHRAIDRALYEEIGDAIGKGHTRTHKLITTYQRETSWYRPPLKYVKDGLASGFSTEAVFLRWAKKSHDASRKSISKLRNRLAGGGPQSSRKPSKLSGITASSD
jgi:hypothetical protein